MKNIKRILMILSLIFVLNISMDVSAETNYIYDQADLLTESEEEELQTNAERLNNMWNMHFLVVTTDNADGKSSREYADDFYDVCFPESIDEDGVLYLIDMDNGEIYLSTSGETVRYLTDSRINWILDEAFYYVGDAEYYKTFCAFFDATEDCLSQGIPSDQYTYDEETGEKDYYNDLQESYEKSKTLTGMEIMVAVIAALLIAGGTCGFIVGKYQLKFEDFHYDAYTDSDIQLHVKEDRLVNSFITHRRIPKNNNTSRSGGGGSMSSTHRSSSGRSHGGGGRKF